MMSTISLPSVLRGAQEPRLSSVPPFGDSAGDDAIALAAKAGLFLDEWQQSVLRQSLGERPDGKWVTSDVGICVSRQNGKNAILEARELAGLFLFNEELIIHTAHEMKAAAVTFRRIVGLINSTPSLKKRVKNIAYSKGDEGIELHNGNRLRFMARTGGSGRSFSADTLILDEAYNLPEHVMNALTPTLAARPNPQTWYTSSAVNQIEHPHGLTLARMRRRALGGSDPRLAYFEWSGDDAAYAADAKAYAADRAVWAMANPGLGIRIPEEFLADQLRRLGPKGFATEHLSIGDWPEEPDTDKTYVVDPDVWDQLVDRLSVPRDPVAFGIHVMPDRSSSAICVAGCRDDGLVHVEVAEERRGVAWVVDRAVEMVARNGPCATVIDPAGPAGALIVPLEQAGVEVKQITMREYGQACGRFYVAATERSEKSPLGGMRHQDDPRLNTALESATTRPLSGAWVWGLDTGAPLVGVTLAMHGLAVFGDNDGGVNLW
jgi:hypothetical protein